MKTAKNRISLTDLPDIFGPRELAMALGIHQQAGYELVHRRDFPSIHIGRKFLVNKQSFLRWLTEQEKTT